MSRAVVLLSAAAALAACTSDGDSTDLAAPALPACGDPAPGRWDDRLFLAGVTGPSSIIEAMVALPDGRIVVGGTFDAANGEPARNVAIWDGATWQAMGPGLAPVTGLAVAADGAVWAIGGEWIDGPRSYVARWVDDRAGWTNVAQGSGVTSAIATVAGGVAVAGHLDGLIPGAGGLAIWNGAGWTSLGLIQPSAVASILPDPAGLCAVGIVATVDAAAPHRGISCWNAATTTWTAIGPSLDPPAVGRVTAANRTAAGQWWVGIHVEQSAAQLAYLEADRWQVVPGRLQTPTFDPGFPTGSIRQIVFRGGDVIVGGHFDQLIEDPVVHPRGLATWNGSTWASYAGGGAAGVSPQVNAIIEADGVLHVAGAFDGFSGIAAANVATVAPAGVATAWTTGAAPLGATGIERLIADAAGVTALGQVTAGAFVDRGAARLDDAWAATIDEPLFRGTVVDAARRSNGTLVLGTGDDVVVGRDGSWRSLGLDRSAGSPVIVDDRDRVYARSYDAALGRSEVVRIDDTERTSLGTLDGEVFALAITDGALIAGVSRWDAGTQDLHRTLRALRDGVWSALPDPPAAWASLVGVPGHGLVVAGAGGIHAWNAGGWHVLAAAEPRRFTDVLAGCDGGVFTARGDPAGLVLELFDGTWRDLAPLPYAADGLTSLAFGPLGLYVAARPAFTGFGEGAQSTLAIWRY